MEVNTGNMSTFFGAVDAMGFYGATNINPTDMRNNCVSVSLCRLLGYANVQQLWRAAYGYDLPDQPLSERGIRNLCGLTGWLFQWQRFNQEPGVSAYDVMMRDIQIRFTTLRAVLYIRANGTGHAVNAFFSNVMGEGPRILLLADWQSHQMGQPVPGIWRGLSASSRSTWTGGIHTRYNLWWIGTGTACRPRSSRLRASGAALIHVWRVIKSRFEKSLGAVL
ncbi:hypothetical protein N657DRAFT_330630 [Parathielavia appendiculata]|uniref:Uncharacterized protein n=1 Tax=Parathielavia appendiculata TaxID=2587402 RepID=A0AAN6U2R0_9PEZI|nr:hypothetical protein N657DRAFT_330630 [Parathielavia appendiculata]